MLRGSGSALRLQEIRGCWGERSSVGEGAGEQALPWGSRHGAWLTVGAHSNVLNE